MREQYDERVHRADDCLGQADARYDPAATRVAARGRMRKSRRKDHCRIANAPGEGAQRMAR
jgi:hypothetical protein